jgi:peptidase S41-like protein
MTAGHLRWLALALASLGAGCAGPAVSPPAPCPPCAPAVASSALSARVDPPDASTAFDPALWLEDLHALIAMSSHYANLDFAIRERRMDLAKVRRRAEDRLHAARSDDDAKRAFRQFLSAFGDAHLGIDWTPAATETNERGTRAGPLCARIGYEERQDRGGVDFAQVPGFASIDDADATDVPGGVLTLPGGEKLGVIRIAVFMETAHPALCEAARVALGFADDKVCESDQGTTVDRCEGRIELEVANRLTAALERRAASLAHAGVAAVAVDITGNGGGTNWVEPAARVLTPVRIEVGAFGAVRHEHWVKQLDDRVQMLEANLSSRGDLDHGVIAPAIEALRGEIAEVKTPCDQRSLWEEGQPKPSCTQLVRVSPVLAYAKPGALAARPDAEQIFGPARFQYHEGANGLPLVVLVDGGTASAAEEFAEMLQDHHAAIVMGAQTAGAGCGFTNGGIPTVLPRSGAHVRLPDCARFRRDGTNAVAGVTPDVLLPIAERDSPYQRAAKVLAGVRGAWRVMTARAGRRP